MSNGVRIYMCPNCKWSDFFPAKTCPRCLSGVKESLSSGRGKVVTFTIIRYPPKGFEQDAPYVVAIIDLEEGARVIGRILQSPEALRIDQNVHYAGEADSVLQFRV